MIRARLRLLVALIGAAVLGLGVSPAMAVTPAPSPAFATATLKDQATGYCLDSSGQGVGHVYTGPCNGGRFQKWSVARSTTSGANPGVTLQNVATGYFLDSNWAGQVYVSPYNGSDFQKWTSEPPGNLVAIVDAATSRCLSSNASRQVFTSTDGCSSWVVGG